MDEIEEFADEDERDYANGRHKHALSNRLYPANILRLLFPDLVDQSDDLDTDIQAPGENGSGAQYQGKKFLGPGFRRKDNSNLQDEGREDNRVPYYTEDVERVSRSERAFTHYLVC